MTLREERRQLNENIRKEIRQLYEKVKLYPLISLFFIIAILLVITLPYLQVNYQGISNNTEKATLENQYRATLAQILGGIAVGIGLYYTWRRITIAEEDLKATQENIKIAQDNLKVSQEGQITERFTRAVDQLGNEKMGIRLGGIYALERIASESERDYWPIMEILTAYVRINSSVDKSRCANFSTVFPLSMDIQNCEIAKKGLLDMNKLSDIQAALTVLGRRKYTYNNGESEKLNLCMTNLGMTNLAMAHFEGTNFAMAHLEVTNLTQTHLEGANLSMSHFNNLTVLTRANLEGADLMGANLAGTYLEEANLVGANLMGANLTAARLTYARLERANLEGANLQGADLREARNLSLDQLSKVKTLYNTKLDKELLIPLKENYPALFDKPEKMNHDSSIP